MDLTARRVDGAAAYIDRWIAMQREVHRVPGIQVALLHEDRVVLSSAHGQADIEHDVALTPDHRFRIASHSKTFTATAVMQLVEAGRLRLDDRLADHLAFLEGSPAGAVTIREVLAHGSGLVRDGWDGDFWQLFRPFPDRADLERIATDAADVLPANARFKYSNIGFGLLGRVVEAVAGVPYATYVTERIIEPLGLSRTAPDIDDVPESEMVTGYGSLAYADRRLPIDPVRTGDLASATGFVSSASDVVRYAAAHFSGDERLLTDRTKRIMQRTEWTVEGAADTGYGLGIEVVEIGDRRMLGHGGGFPGHITFTLFDPSARFAISVLTNCIDGPAQLLATGAVKLLDLASGDSARADAGSDLGRFCGRFANIWGVFDIVELGGRLHRLDPRLGDPTTSPSLLEVVDERTLRIADAPGFASPGERYEYDWATDGSVERVRGGSALTSYPYERFREMASSWERIGHRDGAYD
jgi:CubicO group peptidase (beta-lactamase class C family)